MIAKVKTTSRLHNISTMTQHSRQLSQFLHHYSVVLEITQLEDLAAGNGRFFLRSRGKRHGHPIASSSLVVPTGLLQCE